MGLIGNEATQFQPGNRMGQGNVRTRRAFRQHAVFAKCFTDDDIRELAAAMLARAVEGDTKAAALICKVLFPEKIVERLQQENNTIGTLVLVMPDDGRAGGALHGKPIDDIDDCDIIDAG